MSDTEVHHGNFAAKLPTLVLMIIPCIHSLSFLSIISLTGFMCFPATIWSNLFLIRDCFVTADLFGLCFGSKGTNANYAILSVENVFLSAEPILQVPHFSRLSLIFSF